MITRKKANDPKSISGISETETGTIKLIEQVASASEPIVFGSDMMDEVIKEPTLDRYLDRSPKLNSDLDYAQMVRILQAKRAAFITAEQKKHDPKMEGEESGETI